MKLLDSTKKKVAAATVATLALASAGVASAFWTTDGSGTGSADTGTDTAWDVTTNAATGAVLTPGGPTQNVVINVHNGSSGVQRLEELAIKVANADGSAWTAVPGCSADDFAIGTALAGTTYTISGINHEIAASDTYSDEDFDIQMVNRSVNQDGCKNVTVPLYIAAS